MKILTLQFYLFMVISSFIFTYFFIGDLHLVITNRNTFIKSDAGFIDYFAFYNAASIPFMLIGSVLCKGILRVVSEGWIRCLLLVLVFSTTWLLSIDFFQHMMKSDPSQYASDWQMFREIGVIAHEHMAMLPGALAVSVLLYCVSLSVLLKNILK